MDDSPIAVPEAIDVRRRNNVIVTGNPAGRAVVFANGFGCSHEVWRNVVPLFETDYRVVRFDYVGTGGSDTAAYDPHKYDSIEGYAQDLLDVLEVEDLTEAVLVGHSVSSMVGVVASIRDSSRLANLVLVGPSPRYVNEGDYVGGFEQADIDGLLDSLDANYLAWSATMAPVIAGNPDEPEIAADLETIFCRLDPTIASRFARVTFLSDNRRDLKNVTVPTLILQCSDDVIAPLAVGQYVHREIPGSQLVLLQATGHMPSLSGPEELAQAILAYLG